MKVNAMLSVACVAGVLLAVPGCTVDKTKEGNLPDVEVKGKTELPEYDVKPADVDVSTTTKQVTVPKVDVNMPPHSDQTPAPADSDK